jgi:hypothetical protein
MINTNHNEKLVRVLDFGLVCSSRWLIQTLLDYLDVAPIPSCHEPSIIIIRKRAAFCSSSQSGHLRSIFVRDTLNLRNTGRPARAVDLLHRLCLVQRLLVIDSAGLDNFHAV